VKAERQNHAPKKPATQTAAIAHFNATFECKPTLQPSPASYLEMRRMLTLLLLLSATLPAAVIQGVALENVSGLALARTRLKLLRLEGNQPRQVAAGLSARNGQFRFAMLPEGHYQLVGVRAGFAETRFAPGRNTSTFFVPQDGAPFLELRLKRLGAITGRTLDENRVGLPGIPVVAYTASSPIRLVAAATSDDRGVYRVGGLPRGRYVIRSGAAQLEDGLNLAPTYHPFTSTQLRDARILSVELDADTTDADVHPVEGALSSLKVKVTGCLGGAMVTVSSDLGRRQTAAQCNLGAVQFTGLAPGEYEVAAEGEADGKKLAGFRLVYLNNEQEVGLVMQPLLDFTVRMANGGLPVRDAGIVVRRRDKAGEGAEIPVTSERMQLAPGSWQITARPPGSHMLTEVKVDAMGMRRPRRDPDPDWFEFIFEYPLGATVTLSTQAAQISGRVTLGSQPAIAAPVYLLATTPLTRRRMNGVRVTQADALGNYRFDGLAPGAYLLLSSFDLAEVNPDTPAAAGAQAITVEEAQRTTQNLELSQRQ
jgi:hypothetical protein